MTAETWAFIDEYGNPNLEVETPGVSKFYIVVAVVLQEPALAAVREALDAVRKDHFQDGQLKSKTLGSKRGRWVSLLAALSSVDYRFYGLVVDKRAIIRASCLQWQRSFYKNLCGRAYGKLMRHFPSLHVRADRYGDEEFKESFAKYINENHRPTLFERGTFEYVPAKDDVLVQLADVMCGLLARCFDPDRLMSAPEQLLRHVAPKLLLLEEWPPKHRVTSGDTDFAQGQSANGILAAHSVRTAEEFLVKHADPFDEVLRCQVAVAERLLFERRFGDQDNHVSTGALLENLRDRGLNPKGEAWFRLNVIAPLRDSGVIITSSQTGYKLPTGPADLATYAQHAETVCVPMLNRVAALSSSVRLATQGQIDVLADPRFTVVRELIEVMEHQKKSR
jgi:hypothetical protein